MSLSTFVQELHDKECSFKLPVDEVKDLEDVVTFVVKTFLPSTFHSLPGCRGRYFIEEIINAGSYFEQTKIKDPNEFDFMLVVKELSDSSSVLLEEGCTPGYTKAKVRNIDQWPQVDAHQTADKSFELAILQFNAFIRQALELTKTLPFRGNLGELLFKKIVSRGKPYKEFSFVQTAYFTWRRTSMKEKPVKQSTIERFNSSSSTVESDDNVEILYSRCSSERQMQYHLSNTGSDVEHVEELDIDIDLMACCHTSLDCVREFVSVNECGLPLLSRNGCHVVLKSCGNDDCRQIDRQCRLISYTKSEQQVMRNLPVDWKIVYKCLKWIFDFSGILGTDSYKLKTSVMYLSMKKSSECLSLEDIILSVLRHLRSCHSRNRLQSFFNSDLNVWNIQPFFWYFVKYKLALLEKIFQRIRDTPLSEYDYNVFRFILQQWIIQLCGVTPSLLNLEKSFDRSELFVFNAQGNTFLEIVRGMEPDLKKHERFKSIPRQMKIMVFIDVIKILFKLLCFKLWSCVEYVICPWITTEKCKKT